MKKCPENKKIKDASCAKCEKYEDCQIDDSVTKQEKSKKAYLKGPKGKKSRKKYWDSTKGKATRERYSKTEKKAETQRKYHYSKKGQEGVERRRQLREEAREVEKWLKEHSGKTVDDYYKEKGDQPKE